MIPYWGYYRAINSWQALPMGSFVIFAPRQDDVTGADFALRSLLPVAYLGASEATFSNADALRADLIGYKSWMDERGIVPLAITYEEEWYPRATHDPTIRGWQIFRGLGDYQIRDTVMARLGVIYGEIKQMWRVHTLAVEPVWHDGRLGGPVDLYAPPVDNVDVLGVDAYMSTDCDPFWMTAPLDATTSPEMKRKFDLEVAQFVQHATVYGRPILMVGQAFRDTTPGSPWRMAPTADQLQWTFDLAQQEMVALAWFCKESTGTIVGLDGLPEQAERIRSWRM